MSCKDHLNSKAVKIAGAASILLIIAGLTIAGLYIYDNAQKRAAIPPHSDAVCLLLPNDKELNESSCENKGCIWVPNDNGPDCYFPTASAHGYSFDESPEVKSDGITQATLSLKDTSARLVDNLIEKLEVTVSTYSDTIFRISLRAKDADRYEVPIPLDLPSATVPNNPLYDVSISDENEQDFNIKVTRKSSREIIFNTAIGGLTFAEQFLQISTKLPSSNLYGLGENTHTSFKHNLNYVTWPMFARDQPPGEPGQNLYGVHPMYMVVEDDGSSHVFLWLNSNAMEAETLPTPGLTLRSIGGIMDFMFFLGPTPNEAIQQYTSVIGRPFMPPYWSLGFQLCRYGYNSLDNLKAAVNRTRDYDIPLDVQYADIDHFDRRLDFTYDQQSFAGLPEYIDELKKDGIHFIIILDPAINAEMSEEDYPVHKRAMENDVYIKWPQEHIPEDNFDVGDVMLGYVWPDNRTAFPDFFKTSTQEWWKKEIIEHYDTLKFDGLWIDMNEPANFGTNLDQPWNWPEDWEPWSLKCPNTTYDDPQYPTSVATTWGKDVRISDKTLCMVGLQGENQEFKHYDVHNLYGWSQTESTLSALQTATEKRGIVISRSTFPSSGRWAGHWLGDNSVNWDHLHHSIIGMLEFNLFGIPYVGADICGFFGNATEEMCERWMELGSFYPYSRNHNTLGAIDQDPGVWPSVAESSRKTLEIRYSLLPYLYTLHYLAATNGVTVVRPLFFEFPKLINALDVDDQFLWGSWFMIAPVLKEGHTSKRVYLPEGLWYDYYEGSIFEGKDQKTVVPAPRDHIPLFVRGGGILPTQRPALNTVLSRTEPLGVIVAPEANGKASGTFYWDEGDSIDPIGTDSFLTADMSFDENIISWTVTHSWEDEIITNLVLSDIRVFNIADKPTNLKLDGNAFSKGSFNYKEDTKVLEMFDLEIPINASFSLTWE